MKTSAQSKECITLIASVDGSEPVVRRRIKKYILANECPRLNQCLETTGGTEISISLQRPKNLNIILKYFCEDDSCVISKNNLESLWSDAGTLGLEDLQNACIRGMIDTMSRWSWLRRLQFSLDKGLPALEASVLEFVRDKFKIRCESLDFTSLSVDQVIKILRKYSFKTKRGVTESRKIALIRYWIRANEQDRCVEANRLLETVDFKKLTQDDLRLHFDEKCTDGHWPTFEEITGKVASVTAQAGGSDEGPIPKIETDEEPVLKIETDEEPVLKIETDEEPVLKIETDEEPVLKIETDEEPVLKIESDEEPVLKIETNEEPVLRIETDEEPVLKIESDEGFASKNENAPSPSPAKIPRPESLVPSQQKQILYLRQLSRSKGFTSLDYIMISNDGTVSQPESVVNLPNFELAVPKLVWDAEAQNLLFLGDVGNKGYELSTAHYSKKSKTTLKLAELPPMTTWRCRFKSVILNGRLYVIGGAKSLSYENLNRTANAEVLDLRAFRTNWQWQPIASMPDNRDLYAAATVAGKIFVIGGLCDTSDKKKERKPVVTNSVISYDPTINKWKSNSSLNFHRCGHAVTVVGQKIYVFGGSGAKFMKESEDLKNMKSTEVYDVREDKWTVLAPMLSSRYGSSAVVVGDKIYVMGGDQTNYFKQQSSVECYDPSSNSWTAVCETVDNEGWFNSVAVIEDPKYFLKGHK